MASIKNTNFISFDELMLKSSKYCEEAIQYWKLQVVEISDVDYS